MTTVGQVVNALERHERAQRLLVQTGEHDQYALKIRAVEFVPELNSVVIFLANTGYSKGD